MPDEIVFFYPEGHAAHFAEGHPERPERIDAVCQGLQTAGWWDRYPHLPVTPLSLEFLSSVHTSSYLDRLRTACQQGSWLDMDTYTTPASWQLALNAAGGAVSVATSVWNRQANFGFALTRPPGHHATRDRGMGFCLINNVAVAAEYLLHGSEKNQDSPSRLAIVDLDLHHGNGTQDIFWQRDDVFYISTHQSPLYPGTGRLEDTGAGPGQGYTANFPLPPGTGNEGFRTVMQELILPLLDRFAPQMVLVSLGFDPHWRDPLGHLMLSAAGLGDLISALADWAALKCQGRLALFLEGGYDLEAGVACTQAAVAALLKQPWQDSLGPAPRSEGSSWSSVIHKAHTIWQV